MKEYLELGATPADEDCAQVGSDNYRERMREESKRYIALLEKMFPDIPAGCAFVVKGFPHDLGTYHEVCIRFDPDDEAQCAYAYHVEENLPASWQG